MRPVTSDLFHPDVPDAVIDQFFAVAALTPWHTYQLLTKRPERMRDYMLSRRTDDNNTFASVMFETYKLGVDASKSDGPWGSVTLDRETHQWSMPWPLPNVWMGTSIEDQPTADARIPILLDTPAAIRWVSAEPLLGPIKLTSIDPSGHQRAIGASGWSAIWKSNGLGRSWLDWVVVGGESGPGARPMHPAWPRLIRDDCARAGVAFFFKQWGSWMHGSGFSKRAKAVLTDGRILEPGQASMLAADRIKPVPPCEPTLMLRTTKEAAGRVLDGRIYHAFPEPRVAA